MPDLDDDLDERDLRPIPVAGDAVSNEELATVSDQDEEATVADNAVRPTTSKKQLKADRNARFREALVEHFRSIYEPGKVNDELPVSDVQVDYEAFVAKLDRQAHPSPWTSFNHVCKVLKTVAPCIEKRKCGTIVSGCKSSPAFYVFIRRKKKQ